MTCWLTISSPIFASHSSTICKHTLALLYSLVVYSKHAFDEKKPEWLKLRGTRFESERTLRNAGIRTGWVSYLNVMLDFADVKKDDIVFDPPVDPDSKKKGEAEEEQ